MVWKRKLIYITLLVLSRVNDTSSDVCNGTCAISQPSPTLDGRWDCGICGADTPWNKTYYCVIFATTRWVVEGNVCKIKEDQCLDDSMCQNEDSKGCEDLYHMTKVCICKEDRFGKRCQLPPVIEVTDLDTPKSWDISGRSMYWAQFSHHTYEWKSLLNVVFVYVAWKERINTLPLYIHTRTIIGVNVFTKFNHQISFGNSQRWCETYTNLAEYCKRFDMIFDQKYGKRLGYSHLIVSSVDIPYRYTTEPNIQDSYVFFYNSKPIGYLFSLRSVMFPYSLNPPYFRMRQQYQDELMYQNISGLIFINQSKVDDSACVPWIQQLCNVKLARSFNYPYQARSVKMEYHPPTNPECQETTKASWQVYKVTTDAIYKPGHETFTREGCCEVSVPAYTFDAGVYIFRLTLMHIRRGEKVYNFQECILTIYNDKIQARFNELVRVVNAEEPNSVVVEASDINKEPGLQKLMLGYTWSCKFNGTDQPCKEVERLLGNSRSTYIPPHTLQVGASYTFTVKVTSPDHLIGIQDTSAVVSQKLIVTTKIIEFITLFCATCDDSNTINPQEYNIILIRGKDGAKSPTPADYEWKVADEVNGVVGEFRSVENIRAETWMSYYELKIKKGVLEHDKAYVFWAGRTDRDYVFAEIRVTTPALHKNLTCELNPKDGIRGWTNFEFQCDFEEAFLYFEFYDKEEKDELLFGGRMLGYNNYGTLNNFKMTKGKFFCLIFDKHSISQNWTLTVTLSPFNETLMYLEQLLSSAWQFVNSKTYDWPSATASSVSDVMEQDMSPSPQNVKDPMLVLKGITIDDTLGLLKMVLSSLKVVLENTDKNFEILELDAHLPRAAAATLFISTVKLREQIGKNDRHKSLTRSVFFNMIQVVLDCAEIIVEQKNRVYRSKPEEYVITYISDLVQDTSVAIIDVLDTASYSLVREQIPGDQVGEIVSARDKFLASTIVDFSDDLSNRTISGNSSVVISSDVVSSWENSSQLLGLQFIRMRVNPFWWAGANIVTEVILVNFCRRTKQTDCYLLKYLNAFLVINLNVTESLEYIVPIEGTTYQVDPETTEECKELELTVYRFFLPKRAKLFLKFLTENSQEYRVMLTEGLRPVYDTMINEASVISQSSPDYNVSYSTKDDYDRVYYIGILPSGDVKTGEKSAFRLKTYYSLCNTWVKWQWTSYGCWVGNETNEETMQCDCSHLSVIGGAMTVPEHGLDPVDEFLLYLTPWENLIPLLVLLLIMLFYLLLLIWSIFKDKKDLKKGEVIILEDNFPGERYAYLIGVRTGSRINSGTEAAVGLRLVGDKDDSRPHILKSPDRQVLQAFSEDWFLIYYPRSLGNIRRLWVWHNDEGSSPDWFVETIEVYDLKSKVQYVFEINTWIVIDVDAVPDVFVAPVRMTQYFGAANVFRYNFVNGVRNTHNWTSICLKHPRNPVSRVDRVNVVACYVFTAMAVCLLLYLYHFGFDIDEDKPSYYMNTIDFVIFVLTLVIASIVCCLVMWLFKRSFTNRYNLLNTPRNVRLSRQSDSYSRMQSIRFSEDDELTIVREMKLGQYRSIDKSMDLSETFYRFRYHEKPRFSRSTVENTSIALQKIARGHSLLPLRLPGSKSDLVIRKPWFVAAWIVCLIVLLVSTFIILFFAWRLPTVKDEKFLTTFLGVVVFDIVVISFFKILLFSAIFSLVYQYMTPGTTYHIKIKDGSRPSLFGNIPFLANLLETRKKSIYYPLPESVKELKIQSKLRKYRWRILLEFIMILLLALVISMICHIYFIERYMSNAHATQMITTGDYSREMNLEEVLNRTDYYMFLQYSYVGRIYRYMWYNYEPLMDPESVRKDWTDDCVSRLLGNTRIRQLRVYSENCTKASIPNQDFCAPSWADGTEDKGDYSTSWMPAQYEDTFIERPTWKYSGREVSNSSRFYGRSANLYHGGGFIAVLGYSKRETRGALLDLELEGWLDHMTRAVFVELTLYNVNTNLFTQVVLVTEQHATGQFISLPKVDSVSINIGFDVWNVSFIIFQVVSLLKALYFMNRRGMFVYFSSILNKYEVFLIAIGFTTVVFYIVHVKNSSIYVEEYQRKGLDEFFSFFKIIRYDYMSKAIMCFLFLCVVIKLLSNWRFGKIYFAFYYTILLSWYWIVWSTIFFAIGLLILWRFIGYILNVFIFSYYSIVIIYSKDFKIAMGDNWIMGLVIVYLMRIMSAFVILMFIASFTHFYGVAKYYKPFSEKNVDNFNYGTFVINEVKRLLFGRKKK